VTHSEKKKDQYIWAQFLLKTGIAIIFFTVGIFIILLVRNNNLVNSQIKTRAKAHIDQILKTRSWNAHYGGVYVEKRPGMESNPYLDEPDFEARDGKIYTLKNPALMTREISELLGKDRLFRFHMTSLKPINPANKPDEFEGHALRLFEKGKKEHFVKEELSGQVTYKYIVPVFIEQACLKCHAKQGYKLGDLRGGISVAFDITDIEKSMKLNKFMILSLGAAAAIAFCGIVYAFTFILMKRLQRAQVKIKELALTDELTGLYNRRYYFDRLSEEIKRSKRFRHSISCILLDIDHFKNVNDTYGHQAGDIVLQNVSAAVRENCREIDIVARYGGEEIVVLLPSTDLKGSYTVAEKIRESVERWENRFDDEVIISVTVSLGVVSFTADDLRKLTDMRQIIQYADSALYRAKEKGRNVVEISDGVVM
jgi:diguanylate cyclase (GGDEF)-like protein